MNLVALEGKLRFVKIYEKLLSAGFKEIDEFIGNNGLSVNLGYVQEIFREMKAVEVETTYEHRVRRREREVNFTYEVVEKDEIKKHGFEAEEVLNSSNSKTKLRDSWLRNM
ncbi:hypothetical protein E1171_13715 [Cytophagales bacterium RKSG123]|nr:hypothetical protein [Xanthovirga aplysinae]